MDTTSAVRDGSASRRRPRRSRGAPPVRLGVLWDYPFSLVRRLALAFVLLLALCAVGAYVLTHENDSLRLILHIAPVALAILISMYVVELVGVTEWPLPPINAEALCWSIATSCIVMAIGYSLVPTYPPGTLVVCAAPLVATLCVYGHRKWVEARGLRSETVPAVLYAGSRRDAAGALAELAATPTIRVQAVILPRDAENRSPLAGLPIFTAEEGRDWSAERDIQLFLVANARPEDLSGVLSSCAGAGYLIDSIDSVVARMQGRIPLDEENAVPLLARLTTQAHRFSAQRILDLAFALIALGPGLVLGVLVAVAVKLTSRGPVLYKQCRVGLWGREFTMLKFRTMKVDAEKATGPVWARKDDPRLTPIGGFLRRVRLDELPQIWNVLRGEMSLVGPRPERPAFVERLRREIPFYDARHAVRPGLTGWAQVRFEYAATADDAKKKLAYELFYIFNRSFTFYFTILLETVKVLVFQRGSR